MNTMNLLNLRKMSAALLLALLSLSPALSAPPEQETNRGNQRQFRAQAGGEHGERGHRRHLALKRLANQSLSEEERATLRDARQQAMQDEEVRTALADRPKTPEQRRQLRELIKAKMLEADPTVEPLLDKLRAAAQEHRQNRRERRERFENLTDEQRQTLREARQAAREDPQVREAREEVKAAAENLREAIHEAMLQSSPEVRQILDSVKPAEPEA
jgi:Spy/CpxP family protein refolding chaperone